MAAVAPPPPEPRGMLEHVFHFALHNKLVVAILVVLAVFLGLVMAPFDWEIGGLPRHPVAVDAIPDTGENQQIVFTEWMGRSPQDVEDQVTYPLTVALLGVPGVKTIRSYSFFGFSSIYIIFDEDIEFYWSRSRVLEKLSSLPAGSLPDDVQPALGPDATALGQVYWYTLEGRTPDGEPAPGWDPQELRALQDWTVRYALMAAEGVSEVASIGGYVPEYQIDVDPDAMRAHGVTLEQVFSAVRQSNVDVGARTIEINRVEYVIRGLGFIENIEDIEQIVIAVRDNIPIRVQEVAKVVRGPAQRRGALDKAGAEAVGGVVVVRYGANPLEVIQNVKAQIAEIAPGLPAKAIIDRDLATRAEIEGFAQARGFDAYMGAELNQDAWVQFLRAHPQETWPEWATLSQVTIVPFYDRTGLILETLGTLSTALLLQILVTILVVVVMLAHLRSSLLISALLPLAVLMCFIAMKLTGIAANIVALSGIAIAIGTMVDMGIILLENILRRLQSAPPGSDRRAVIFEATREVGGAVMTALLTTVISFLPVFTMTGAEGKLFKPLAFTKTYALIAALIVALVIIPPAAHLLLRQRRERKDTPERPAEKRGRLRRIAAVALVVLVVGYWLSRAWMPLGLEHSLLANFFFVGMMVGAILLFFHIFLRLYVPILRWVLVHKAAYLALMAAILLTGVSVWLGFERVLSPLVWAGGAVGIDEETFEDSTLWTRGRSVFPGLGKEFMPPLDEGSFLYMPTAMPHASIGEVLDVIRKQDMAFVAIPEVESAAGKLGRVDSPLDPAPVSMIETVINYKSEYITDKAGHVLTFRYDEEAEEFVRDDAGELIPDEDGQPFRQWRDHIESPDDIWDEIVAAGQIPGTTSAPKLQPIAARMVMLQSGMRAPMGMKVKGPDLATIERVGLELERLLKEVPGVKESAVFADRVVGKPYLEIDIDREAIGRYGLRIRDVQDVIEVAIGGRMLDMSVEGRERFPIRVRYQRELRDDLESLGRILVPAPGGAQIPLEQLADIRYVRGPQAIKSEDTFLVSYVLFDKQDGYAEVDVVEAAQVFLQEKIEAGELIIPSGVSYSFAGNYENQLRATRTLALVLPIALLLIFLILYLQFRSVGVTGIVFTGIAIAWSGGFILIWFYSQEWFLDFSIFGENMRELFQVGPINLSVAIWVGFLALFGIATDDGVVIATYLGQSFERRKPKNVKEIREATVAGASRRIRPCIMTTATTVIALLPVLTSTGRGSDVMVPMAIPTVGGMMLVQVSVFMVPVLYCWMHETRLRARRFEPMMLARKIARRGKNPEGE